MAVDIKKVAAKAGLEVSDADMFGTDEDGKAVTRKFSGVYSIAEVEACLRDMREVEAALAVARNTEQHG